MSFPYYLDLFFGSEQSCADSRSLIFSSMSTGGGDDPDPDSFHLPKSQEELDALVSSGKVNDQATIVSIEDGTGTVSLPEDFIAESISHVVLKSPDATFTVIEGQFMLTQDYKNITLVNLPSDVTTSWSMYLYIKD